LNRHLDRTALAATGQDATAAPARIAHFGLGAFHRAHQAWYTHRASDRSEWGIIAFTGRSDAAAKTLAAQDGVYTLIQRGSTADEREIVTSIVRTVSGDDVSALLHTFRAPELAIVTLTITERGYRLTWDGSLDTTDELLMQDLEGLRAAEGTAYTPRTALGRLLLGFDARRRAGLPGLAVIPCDNVPANGRFLSKGALDAAARIDPLLRAWIADNVSFVSTSVDRITPRLTADDVHEINRRAEFEDAAPVITEPFTDWVLCGSFPAGRPAWEESGARFVGNIEPWERRKLWMLNGAHTLLANAGQALGHHTVAEAVADDRLSAAIDRFWDEASSNLPQHVDGHAYARSLRARFSNPRIEHRLDQIGEGTPDKLKLRIVPIALAERAHGRDASACAFAIGGWAVLSDLTAHDALRALSQSLADDAGFTASVRHQMARLETLRAAPSESQPLDRTGASAK
jgi:fructuronate reductase